MTGDISGVAQSPYVRTSAHLGFNKNNNAVRHHLAARGVMPEDCESISFLAFGPVRPYSHGQLDPDFHTKRKLVGALERKLWAEAEAAGNTMLNGRPQFPPEFDASLWNEVRAQFAHHLNLAP